MSEAKPENSRAMSAREIKARAAYWLERQERADWNERDRAELEAWIGQSLAHEVAYIRLESAWKRTERLVVLRSAKPEQGSADTGGTSLFMRAAAMLAIVAGLGTAGDYLLMGPHDRVFSTPVGGHETVAFADGSKIELNTNTVLRSRMTTSERIVWLDKGEAYFQVKHDAAHPFTVIVGARRVTDLGTKFVVRRDASRLEVALLDGSVRFSAAKSQYALLKPGDVAVATANSMSVTSTSSQVLANKLGWRHGILVFKNTTLADAAKEFNRYNQKKLVIADPATARLKIYGTFHVQDVDLFARVTQDILGLSVRNDGDEEIVISR